MFCGVVGSAHPEQPPPITHERDQVTAVYVEANGDFERRETGAGIPHVQQRNRGGSVATRSGFEGEHELVRRVGYAEIADSYRPAALSLELEERSLECVKRVPLKPDPWDGPTERRGLDLHVRGDGTRDGFRLGKGEGDTSRAVFRPKHETLSHSRMGGQIPDEW